MRGMKLKTLIRLNNISKSYGSQKILDRLDFTLQLGQRVSISGVSGCGKSTLLNIIGLMDTFDAGHYCLNESIQISRYSDERSEQSRLRNQYFGFIFQAFHLLSYRTVLDNVCLPLFYRNEGLRNAQEKALEMLEAVGLVDKAGVFPSELSGGQQQRVAIARSLVTRPLVLLADEPTGSLDWKTADQVMTLIFDLQKKYQMACIVVTHDTGLAKQCEVQYTLERGQLCV